MADYFAATGTDITFYDTAAGTFTSSGQFGSDVNITDNDAGDNQFDTTEAIAFEIRTGPIGAQFIGSINIGGTDYPIVEVAVGNTYVAGIQLNSTTYPTLSSITSDPGFSTANFTVCFAAGTFICTALGARVVEDLKIGDEILSSEGQITRVKWIGRQTVHKLFSGPHMQPVRIRAGALGDGVPHTDLTVTADHGMLLDGLVINASALVNGHSIDWVPVDELPDQVTYYHIETENHDVILANGAPAETFVDAVTRKNFDNYQEYLDLYGAERFIPEMERPRISSQRLLPQAIRERLGFRDQSIPVSANRMG